MEVSKKLVLDANGEITIDDGAEAKEEMNKEADDLAKEAQKDLDAAIDIALDINDAKPEDFKMVDGAGKKLNLKALKEKLTLDEEEFEEAIPFDLARAYKKSGFKVPVDTDLQASEYTEISPEAAFKLIKQGEASKIRLLVTDAMDRKQLVTLKDTGYGSNNFRTKYVSHSKAYVKRNGDTVTDTAHMPVMHLLSVVADKIYVTNEDDTKKDRDLLAKRSENPESPRYPKVLRSRDGYADVMPRRTGTGSYYGRSYYASEIKNYENRLRNLKAELNNGEISQDEYDREKARYTGYIRRNQQSIAYDRDKAARLRNLDSETNLQKNIIKFGKLKDSVSSAKGRLEDSEDRLTRIKDAGSPETRRMKEEYNELLKKLQLLQRNIALYELKLEDTDDSDNEALKQAQQIYDTNLENYQSILSDINKLLRRS